ncbi:MAG: thioredoxin family protein [Melioribacteraceae bacterium]|nr:thioredoxin family protein [Melioribacteraceae bacterium]MCF8355390.1 thioredoxin family protein [Melioribacteraceae bacterium]MCF8394635.1 thioredoxin family protein [Melioribacteraceae bacterium]MCF8419632.1 thioredoxin family protein [Melioribacteraceae bacterium]
MAETPSVMVELGTSASNFKLYDTITETEKSLEQLKSDKCTVIMFICNHCPYVKHVNEELVRLANDYIPKGVSFIAISSNDVENYPEDSPEKMRELAERLGYPFPYLYDETQEVAKAYNATCTPDFYVYDGNMKLVYRGQLDDSRPGSSTPVTGKDLRSALDNILMGKPVDENQIPSVGCNIKWKR